MNQNPTPSIQIVEELIENSQSHNPKIAFLPYKMAMWDCMETVYIAAKAKGLVADIIPISYLTKGDQKWHNEGIAFESAGYQIGHYENEMLPKIKSHYYDYLVIHYPYDNRNRVTQIAPEVYSWKLKEYGTLVYIPYHGNLESVHYSGFYGTTGAMNSDIIVLGSENDVKCFKRTNPDYMGKIIQTEISTKAECAKYHEMDPEPELFADLRYPVILLCGSLLTFTTEGSGRMKKHIEIIQREKRKGSTIIYRPHPLVQDALAVMRPQAMEPYENFLSQILPLVHYDDSPYLSRAMRAADKLISDPSSVVRSWIPTGKPYEVIE